MSAPLFFDTHVHFGDGRYDSDRFEVIEECRREGIGMLVEIADGPEEWEKAIDLCRLFPHMLHCSLGLHPYLADQWSEDLRRRLAAQTELPQVRAIGEIGLDYAKSPVGKEAQTYSFEKMLDAADALDLPVVIHCREAYPDMMSILRERYRSRQADGFHGVLHCFSGDKGDALEAVSLGFALGVDGPITYPKNEALRDAIRSVSLSSIVLETDSPYLPPQSSRGKRNDPTALKEIGGKIADIFGVPLEEVARMTSENGKRLFRIPPEAESFGERTPSAS